MPQNNENENPEVEGEDVPQTIEIFRTLDTPRGGVLPQNENPQESLKILHPPLKKKIEIAEHEENI